MYREVPKAFLQFLFTPVAQRELRDLASAP